jgi:ABC-type transporter Mla MlaB component
MLKISEVKSARQTTTFRLEGQLVGPWVDELKQVCAPLMKNSCPVTLDLADVVFVDAAGVAALTRLSDQGAKLLNATPFVAAQLDGSVFRAAKTPPA